MDRQNLFRGLSFYNQALIHVNIQPQSVFDDVSFVLHRHKKLIARWNPAKGKFSHETFLVNALQQTGAFQAMNFDCCADDLVRPTMSLLVVWVHKGSSSCGHLRRGADSNR